MSIFKTISEYKNELNKNGKPGLSMQLRLFVFLILFLLAIMSGVLIILLLTGALKAGEGEAKTVFENELKHIAEDVYVDFGNISVQGVALSNSLSSSIENKMKDLGINVYNFGDYPQYLERILAEQLDKLTSSLEKTKSSGVFLMLDATVNKNIEDSEYSRAGIYIRNMEPNIINGLSSNLRFLHGPMSLALENNIYILPQWKMEFNTKNALFFNSVMNTAKNSNLALSRLYYWTDSVNLKDDSTDTMLCIVPLISKDKTVFGLCGFEVSSMLFKLSYSPNDSKYNYLFCMFSEFEDNEINANAAFFAGSYYYYHSDFGNEPLTINSNPKFLNKYKQKNSKENYIGLHKIISLYPSDSAYKNDKRVLSILIPEDNLNSILSKQNNLLIYCFSLLLILSIVTCSFISKKYMRPVVKALDLLKTVNPAEVPKTNIIEIDDLIEFLAEQDEIANKIEEEKSFDFKNQEYSKSTLFMEFIKNIDTLSMAEKAVFNLYLKGHTAKEIADILCLSINTIKTHNKRIYMKLNVSSRKELMVYIKMMEETNKI